MTDSYSTTADEFSALVADEVRGYAPAGTRERLQSDELLDEWYQVLSDLKRSVESQMTERLATMTEYEQECRREGYGGKAKYYEAKAEYTRWRAGAVRFKTSVESRLQIAKRLRIARDDRIHAAKDHYKRDLMQDVARLTEQVRQLEARLVQLERDVYEEEPAA